MPLNTYSAVLTEYFQKSFFWWVLVFTLTWPIFSFVYNLRFIKSRLIQKPSSLHHDMAFQIKWGVFYILTASLLGTGLVAVCLTGKTGIYLDISQYGWLYFFASVVIYLVGFDFYFYAVHRLLHTSFLYKHVHSVHHAIKTPSALTVFCCHPAEIVFFYGYHIIMIFLMPLHPTALLTITFFIHAGNIFGHFGHETMPAGFVKRFPFISTSFYHDLHHQRSNLNYAYFFTWLDFYFNTRAPDYIEKYSDLFKKEK